MVTCACRLLIEMSSMPGGLGRAPSEPSSGDECDDALGVEGVDGFAGSREVAAGGVLVGEGDACDTGGRGRGDTADVVFDGDRVVSGLAELLQREHVRR